MFRKIGLLFVGVSILLLGGRAVLRALASDEAKIRIKLEDACEGFGDTRMNPILEFLSREFVDETSGFHRDDVRGAVAAAFFQEKDPTTKKFPYRAAVVPDTLKIDVDKTGSKSARIAFVVRITDTKGGQDRNAWEFAVDGTMKDGDDGWQLVSSTHDTRVGSSRLR